MFLSFRPSRSIEIEIPTGSALRAGESLWSSERWVSYFRRNNERLMNIPWEQGVEFSAEDRADLAESVREFQLGESGEGKHFRMLARKWAERSGDLDYLIAQDLFLGEEHRHARDLGRVLDLAGIERAKESKVNDVFRIVRKLAGLELAITMLVTAEIVAQVYYPCLGRSTQSTVIRALCRQIVRDEVQHVRFQCQRLAMLRTAKWNWRNALCVVLQRGLLLVTSQVIWPKHGKVMRRGGLTRWQFYRALVAKMNIAARLMNPRLYKARGAAQDAGFGGCRCLHSCGSTDKTCTLQ